MHSFRCPNIFDVNESELIHFNTIQYTIYQICYTITYTWRKVDQTHMQLRIHYKNNPGWSWSLYWALRPALFAVCRRSAVCWPSGLRIEFASAAWVLAFLQSEPVCPSSGQSHQIDLHLSPGILIIMNMQFYIEFNHFFSIISISDPIDAISNYIK